MVLENLYEFNFPHVVSPRQQVSWVSVFCESEEKRMKNITQLICYVLKHLDVVDLIYMEISESHLGFYVLRSFVEIRKGGKLIKCLKQCMLKHVHKYCVEISPKNNKDSYIQVRITASD